MSDRLTLGRFGDPRREERGARILERVLACGSLTIRTVGENRAGELGMHRFLDSPQVKVAEILATVADRTAAACAGRRILAVQDTSEINFRGRDRARRGLGKGGDGVGLGFFLHPVIAVDLAEQAVLGLLGAEIWSRKPGQDGEACRTRRQRALAAKESQRWLNGAQTAAAVAGAAEQVVVVGDRDSDIYGLFVRRPEQVELLVRAAQDRCVADGSLLFAQPTAWPVLTRYTLQVPSRGPGDAGRPARIVVRAGSVLIKRPRNGFSAEDPKQVAMTLVEAMEECPPPETPPIQWRLLSTLPAATAAQACELVAMYRLRWRIEQTFRALKTDGLGLPDVQVRDAERLFKLAAIGLVAAVRTIQLVDARDGSKRPAVDVADETTVSVAEAIGPTLEGKTERQKNPHPPRSLAWLSWVIARLGGWTGYYKPPGPKVMRRGWDRFAAMAEGYRLAAGVHSRSVVAIPARIP